MTRGPPGDQSMRDVFEYVVKVKPNTKINDKTYKLN